MGVILEPFVYVLAFLADIYFKVVVVEIVLHWFSKVVGIGHCTIRTIVDIDAI